MLHGITRRSIKEADTSGLLIIILAMVLALLPLVISRYLVNLFIFAGIYFIMALGFSIIYGQGGLISMAHAAFFGIGAYATAILETMYQMPVLLGLPVSFLVPLIISYIIARPLTRLRHLYLALGTLAFGEIAMVFFKEPAQYTGGYSGITGIPPLIIGPLTFSGRSVVSYYYLTFFLIAVMIAISVGLVHSKVGRAIRALRDNEVAAEAMGVNPVEYKTFVYSYASGWAGVAGWLYAHYSGAISPGLFSSQFSILLMLVLFIGGLRSLWGAAVGALFLAFIPPYISRFGQFQDIVYGLMIVIVLMFMPQGIVGIIRDLYRRARSGSWQPGVAAAKEQGT